MTFLNWERFIFALIHCYYKSTDTVVFSKIFLMMGRGNGKNGFISALAFYFTTPVHGVVEYDIDIVANCESQAKTSFKDVYRILTNKWDKCKKFFTKTKEIITNTKTNSYIMFNTSTADTKDGKRTGCLICDEIHGYETWETINVFESGLGKKKHPRVFYITTNGHVRGGVLDEELEYAQRVLNGEIDADYLPLIYKMDDKEEIQNEELWEKANPSINDKNFIELKKIIRTCVGELETKKSTVIETMTKRFNLPVQDTHLVVAVWEKILLTNRPIPYEELKGRECIGAIDYAEIKDFASVGLLFKKDGLYYFMEHSFVNYKMLNPQQDKIKFPIEEKADEGLITIVYDEIISPDYISAWFLKQAETYRIKDIVGDSFRMTHLKSEFKEKGLPIKEVRSGEYTHAKVTPTIDTIFEKELLILGDNATMRWYINNTCRKIKPNGNTVFEKIEPKTRKTDGFFALIHALTQEDSLTDNNTPIIDLDVVIY